MEDLKVVFASNLIRLRTDAGMTQAQLAEKLNYSDKSVSKWERGEALPDVIVVKTMADLFGVTVDFMLTSHDQWQPAPMKTHVSTSTITIIVQLGIWTVAALLFVIFWMLNSFQWVIFAAALPASLITLLVLNSVWGRRKYNLATVSLLILSLLGLLYVMFAKYRPWQLFLLAVPALAIVWFSFHVRRKKTVQENDKEEE
jgi:transcriptional regulator with XRE-family HTH domain